jgi:hypothetical protein
VEDEMRNWIAMVVLIIGLFFAFLNMPTSNGISSTLKDRFIFSSLGK